MEMRRDDMPEGIPDYPDYVVVTNDDGLFFAWTKSFDRPSRTAGFPTAQGAIDQLPSIVYEDTEYGIIPKLLAERLRAAGSPPFSHAEAREAIARLRELAFDARNDRVRRN